MSVQRLGPLLRRVSEDISKNEEQQGRASSTLKLSIRRRTRGATPNPTPVNADEASALEKDTGFRCMAHEMGSQLTRVGLYEKGAGRPAAPMWLSPHRPGGERMA
jgi:hypothetical protein